MKLTPRLQAIAELIEPGSVVADIGTDHGYLPVYLLLEQISQRIVAADVNPHPLQQARETVAAFNCLHKIELRLGDGLGALREEDNVDTVVIAGLGGRTIASILVDGRDKLKTVRHLILQPMNEAGFLRLFLAENGFALVHESLVMEGRRLYEIILAKPGMEQEKDPFRLSLGPRLLEKKPPLFDVLLKEKIRKLRIMYNSLQKARQKDLSGKIREVEKELQCLEEVLSGAVERADTD
ncbi:tRNA (adenine(22)-N(1))-methyltransferase [Dethiobacter alkaliphilus]|uniref:tRNA (adenine(22)-N(1))-methyltransferase n=1 Tax=Dethiobacter alkaliphilus TaxID=427926 RepID=UPI0022263C20|nr:class I SAM-dependent methyltransferase [Dethiobacter alkaliphilus]MCW3489367.1 class I SAM-dependent methyltransferase [Dethiobacter alkaliphilus]